MSDTTITEFTPGDIVISVVGDDNNSGSYGDNQAAPIALEEIDPTTGDIVGELVLPQTTTINSAGVTEYAISGEYGSSSEGSLELAGNGESLVIAGYGVNAATFNTGGAAVYGNAALAQSTSEPGGPYTPVARVIADISYNGTVDTSTALFNVFNVNNPRSVATINGSTFYISGQGDKTDPEQGVYVTNDGSGTQTQILDTTDTRTVEIYNGQLYVSYDSKTVGGGGIYNFGSTLPASETAGTSLPGIGPSVTLNGSNGNSLNGNSGTVDLSPENFFFANSTTLYIADGGQPKEGTVGDGGLQKWSYNGSTWVLDYTLTAGLNLVENGNVSSDTDGSTGLIGMTAVDNSDGTVTFYVTNSTIADLDQTYLYTITDTLADTNAAQANGESFSVLVTAAADTNIRGVAFAPTDTTPVSSTTIPSGTTSSVTVTSGSTVYVASGGTISGSTILSSGLAYISGTDSGTYVAEGGQEVVSGGASDDTVYGTQIIASGGVAFNEAVFSNGLLGIASGGTASDVTVNSGGTVMLSGGGTLSGLTISGGTVYVDTAADAIDGSIVFSGAGEIVLSAGGLPGGTLISGFGVGDGIDLANIGSGATLSSAFDGNNTSVTVTSGGVSETFVFSGAYASGYFELTGDPVLTVNPNVAESEIIVSAGMTSSGLSITSGQTLLVLSGGTAISNTILSGGSAVVSGTDSATMVQSGGVVSVIGAETSAVISAGGSVTVSGTASGDTISSGGSLTVVSGGNLSDTAILSGGTETVYGSATGDAVYGTQNVSGFATSETVFSGGALNVITTGAGATDITVQSGGTLFLSKAVTVSNVTLSGGTVITNSPKTDLTGSLDFVGSATLKVEDLNSAGYGDLAVISGFGAGDAIDITVIAPNPAPVLTSAVSGGNTDITVSGASGSETFIFAGTGGQFGLTADGTGGVDIVSGAGTIFPASNYVVLSGQTSSGLVISSGFSLTVNSGGTAVSATILSGGTASISGTDSGSTISTGATEDVLGSATGDQIYGTQIVETSTSAGIGGETVYSGGLISVTSKGETISGITVLSGGSLLLSANVVASNTILSGGSLVEQSAKTVLEGSLDFANGGTLQLTAATTTSAGAFGDQALISGFVQGDVIDLGFLKSASSVTSAVTTSGGNTVVTVSSGTGSHLVTETFLFGGTYSPNFFALNADANGDVELVATSSTPCFAAGTRLLGLEGDMPVENIQPGDVLVTVREGGPVSQKVIWTGKRTVNLARHPEPEAVRPVRIIAGAFAPGLPERDLRLSPDHAVYVDGCLFPAATLINGETIYQELGCAQVTYHHIELECHDILLAEGLPTESYLDTGNRNMFASAAGSTVLHPDFAAKREDRFCAPLVREGEALARVQAQLAARTAPFNLKRA